LRADETSEQSVKATDVAAIVVSYNVRQLLLQCVESLEDGMQAGALTDIIVVDNDSTDGSAQAVLNAFSGVSVIEAPNNGYGAGANIGIAATSAEFLLILNPDTIVPPAAVHHLYTYLENHPDVAIAAPRIRYPNGSIQSSRRRFPARLTPVFESTSLARLWPQNHWVRRYYMVDTDESESRIVDWVVGACLMVRRAAIESAGSFDETFWMYCEETEWCWRLRRRGWKVAYVPDAEIVHHEGASSSQNIFKRQLAFDRSRVELQHRMYGPVVAAVCATGIKAGYVIDLLIESTKFLLGHRRRLRRQRIEDITRLLGSKLTGGAHVRQASR
jgi:N-acetylglucosaminyl-diphospho-decaprenol L-rhamnosyltransferase